MSRLVRKLAINVVISSVYPFFNEIKKNFLFILKGGYNGYKAKKYCIPTLIWSFLYLLPTQEKDTMGTKLQKASNTNNLRDART